MKCLILAAGYATRLYPLTENFPKPLLKVGAKTILDWLIDDLEKSKVINEYVVISNHKFAHHFDDWAKDKAYRITVLDDGTTSNENRLGAVKDIQFAIDKLNIEEGCNTDAPGSYISWLCKKTDVYAMEMPGSRYDIGNLESYEKVQKEYKGITKC